MALEVRIIFCKPPTLRFIYITQKKLRVKGNFLIIFVSIILGVHDFFHQG